MSGRVAGLVDEEHRDVVADRVGPAAADADQLLGRLVRGERLPARRAHDHVEQMAVEVHRSLLRMTDRMSSRTRAMVAPSAPSALSRSSGSVLDARTLNHQSAWVTVSPSSWSTSTSSRLPPVCCSSARMAAWSVTSELISPLATC